MVRFLMICAGGAVGTGARFALTGWVMSSSGSTFPLGTLVVNTLGSFLVAVIMVVGLKTELITPATRMFLATGVMGGFTTYSAFNYETLEYLRQGAWFMGCVNVLATGLACLLAGVLGLWVGTLLVHNTG